MPEEIEKSAGEGADAGSGEGGGQEGAENKGANKSDGAEGAEGQQKADADGGEAEKKPVVPQKPAEPVVHQRKTAKDFIIERKEKQIAKLAAKQTEGDGEKADENVEEEKPVEDANEISEQDEELVAKVVAKKFAPILEKHIEAEDLHEIQGFLKDNPDFAPYEAQVKVFMQHPSRRSLPIKSIFYEVAGDDLIKIGAQRQKEADSKAKQTQTGSGSQHNEGTPKSAWEMTAEEFEAEKQKIRNK